MIRALLLKFGWRIVYVCDWGIYDYRYDDLDRMGRRPIHEDMSVAPPWAQRRVVRVKPPQQESKT